MRDCKDIFEGYPEAICVEYRFRESRMRKSKSQKEQSPQVIEAHAVVPMVENIKPDIEDPKLEGENSMTSLGEVACTTFEEGHTLAELEGKGLEFPFLDVGDQKVQEAKEDEEKVNGSFRC